MKIFKKVSAGVAVLSLILSLAGPIGVSAATTPSLGAAAPYAILSSTFSNSSAATTINGSIGFTSGPSQAPLGVHLNYGSGAPYSTAGTDQGTALTALAAQPCTYTFPDTAIDLATDVTHGAIGVYTPGVYCLQATRAASIGAAGITLSSTSTGTFIFRMTGALTSADNSNVTLSGAASACDVFWTSTAATTLGANTTFLGTDIGGPAINVGANTVWNGKALAFGGVVTTGNTVTITAPVACSVQPPSGGGGTGTIVVAKRVINDNGGSKVVADFPLFVNGIPVVSGVSNAFPAPADAYTVTETSDPRYTRTFSGDCDIAGRMNLNGGDLRVCIITNDDIGAAVVTPPVPPLIDVVKVPSPLSLPNGPGQVIYSYTLTNIGTVPVTDVTMIGDTCSPITLDSGDTNHDSRLDVNETWVYHCPWMLSQTHTNTVVATGWANGLSATDIASATVVVGAPIVPPLIHVTKIPNPLALFAGGGMVTYTNKVTNPGTVPLSNVHINDDKCAPVTFVGGDTNSDTKLDPNETWVYTCTTKLTKTTTNTVIASGDANGLTARDFAIATVVVAVAPSLPNTGVSNDVIEWTIVAAGILLAALLVYAIRKKRI